MNWDYPDPFIMDITVSQDDTDRLGHTNNQVYLKWFEQISWQHIELPGMTWALQEELGKALAITRTEVDYLAASYASEILEVGTWITHSDGRLLTSREFQIIRPSDNKVLVRAKSYYACIDLKTGRPSRMPKIIAETLGALCISR
jgi:acyl-CoA thioester hydrolase